MLVLDIVLPVLRSVAVVSATQDTAVLQLVSITQDSVTKQNLKLMDTNAMCHPRIVVIGLIVQFMNALHFI